MIRGLFFVLEIFNALFAGDEFHYSHSFFSARLCYPGFISGKFGSEFRVSLHECLLRAKVTMTGADGFALPVQQDPGVAEAVKRSSEYSMEGFVDFSSVPLLQWFNGLWVSLVELLL